MVPPCYKQSKSTNFFYNVCLIVYISGYPNYWFEALKLSKEFTRIYNLITVINNIFIPLLLFFGVGAFYTQDKMNETQRQLLLVHSIGIFSYCFYFANCIYYKKTIRNVISTLTVSLKAIHNDPVVEKEMVKNNLIYLIIVAFNCLATMVMIDAAAYVDTIRNNVTYTTILTAYPDIHDNSRPANIARVFINLAHWIYITRVFGIYALLPPLASGLSYQYRNLSTYFSNLSEIFERQGLSQEEKEKLYENNFKLGIQMHIDTLGCTRQVYTICKLVFSGQIVMNIFLLAILMAQLVQSDRSVANLLSAFTTAIAVLFTTGIFMWNAGDITVEASHLPTAIYFSGWHKCRNQSRVRKLVTITASFAQVPVVLKGLGYVELSYQSYLTIVKSAYSLFSVLY